MRKTDLNSIEIARLAGVSRSTVSRVINRYPNVPEKTREKVMSVIDRYNYFPNASAQALVGKRTRTIGLFMIEAGHVSSDILSNKLIVSAIEKASSLGYYVLTSIIRNASDSEAVRGVKEMFFQRRIDGGLFIGAANHEPMIEELIGEGFMVAVVDQNLPGRNEPNRIVINYDNDHGMKLAVGYLRDMNHRAIGFIQGDMKRQSGVAKYEGFLKAMEEYQLPVHKEYVWQGSFSEAGGYEAVQHARKRGQPLPTALIAANDSAAFGAIRAFREAGVRVPEDISILGFDDHTLSAIYQPALTTVKTDFTLMMERLTASLIEHLEEDSSASNRMLMSCSLIIRNSCRKL